MDQERWQGKTPRRTRAECSKLIDDMATSVDDMAEDLGLRFVPDKSDRRYIEAGSGGRMVRFFLWFDSVAVGREQPLKMEVSFVNPVIDAPEEHELSSYLSGLPGRESHEILSFRFPDELEAYTRKVRLSCFSPREIYLEKCRAVLTRVGFKWRDLVDIIFLEDRFGFDIESQRGRIIDKTRPVLAFRRYRESFERLAMKDLDRMPPMEEGLLLEPPSDDLRSRLAVAFEALKDLAHEI